MKTTLIALSSVIGLGTALFSVSQSAPVQEPSAIAYPKGYRDWTHVKTYVVGPKSPAFKFIGGFNHVYANAKALQGYKSGHFYNGSVIVSDVIEAREDSVDTREGKRHHLDVMVRDSVKYASSGGWGFEEFSADTEIRILTPLMATNCAACHAKSNDFVFGEYRK